VDDDGALDAGVRVRARHFFTVQAQERLASVEGLGKSLACCKRLLKLLLSVKTLDKDLLNVELPGTRLLFTAY
jgi:hypothetical protein